MVNTSLDHFKINDTLIENLKDYFEGKSPFQGLGLKNLSNNYKWPRKGDFPTIKDISPIKILGNNNYEKNIFLKENSSKIWNEGSKFDIAKWAIKNWGGRVGAWFADAMFTLFGRMAYLMLVLAVSLGWRLYSSRDQSNTVSLYSFLFPTTGFLLAMTGACGLEQIYFPFTNPDYIFQAGGILGHYTANAFSSNFGTVGLRSSCWHC